MLFFDNFYTILGNISGKKNLKGFKGWVSELKVVYRRQEKAISFEASLFSLLGLK
jgi:hypothetical protein